MAFNEELLRAEVHREFERADGMGLEEATRGFFRFEPDDEGIVHGFHVTVGEEERSKDAKKSARTWERTKQDPAKLAKRRAQRLDCYRRRAARERGLASVVMTDGSVWTNPEVAQ